MSPGARLGPYVAAAFALAAPVHGQAPPSGVTAYLELAAQYRDGRFETARIDLTTWSEGAMEGVVEALGKAMDPPGQPAVASAADLEALVLLHAEIGLGLKAKRADPPRRPHLAAIRRLMRVPAVAGDAMFCLRVHLLVGFVDQSRFDLLAARASVEAAVRNSPQDAFSLMALGRLDETEAAQPLPGLTPPGSGGVVDRLQGEARAQLASAADLYRRALALDPSRHEARLRLGRVLQLQGRLQEAASELSAVLERSSDPDHVFMANLLLGALREADGEMSQAEASYRAALVADPHSATAKLALGQALHRLGRRPEALQLVSAVLGEEEGNAGPADAWLLYKMGAFDLGGQIARLWRELRDSVRR